MLRLKQHMQILYKNKGHGIFNIHTDLYWQISRIIISSNDKSVWNQGLNLIIIVYNLPRNLKYKN